MKRALWILSLVLVALVAAFARHVQHRKVQLAGSSTWITTDPDSLHQLRRIERIFEEGPPTAEFDPLESWPRGSALPAPPYYPLVAWAALAPLAPSDAVERKPWLERAACTLPALFAVLTALAAAWAARGVLGDAAGLFAGLCFAVAPGAIQRSCVGNGDYHSWAALLAVLQLGVLSLACARGALDERGPALRWGLALGLLHGLAIGSWTPALLQLVVADAALGVWIVQHVRTGRFPQLARFGLALHVGAALAVLPAVLSSPWRAEQPWLLVNLSWAHVAFPLLGALVFAPLLSSARAPWMRSYPWLVAAALASLGGVLAASGAGPGSALREAFAWLGAETTFMGQVAESAPLVGPGAGWKVTLFLGFGAVLAPFALWFLVRRSLERAELVPWAVALAVFGGMAALQMRFAELAVAPLALGLWCALPARVTSAPYAFALAGVAALALHGQGVASTARRFWNDPPFGDSVAKRSARRAADWLATNSRPGECVLALWGQGHAIAWSAARPIVASPYGSYVGEQEFLDSFRFFAASELASAEALLARRDVRYVLATSDLDEQWATIARAAGADANADGLRRSLVPGLLLQGEPVPFLRLVHVPDEVDERRARTGGGSREPGGLLYERVAGARVEVRGQPGEVLEVAANLRCGNWTLPYRARALVGSDGVARLRVPYSDTGAGSVRVEGGLQARLGGRALALRVTEADVRAGALVRVE